jgi:hypothetical protein
MGLVGSNIDILAGERRKKKVTCLVRKCTFFVINFVHFTFLALKLEKWSVPNMIKRFSKGFVMKIVFSDI